jgi:uncharacterized membrane protein
MTMLLGLAFLIGIVAGLRTMMALAAVSWAAFCGHIDLSHTWFAFAGYRFAPWILSLLAVGELITDQLPSTPSRKVPVQFGARLVSGGLSGAAIGLGGGGALAGAIAGVVGAVVGTLVGAAARSKLAKGFGNDRPAAIIEDVVAIGAAVAIIAAL